MPCLNGETIDNDEKFQWLANTLTKKTQVAVGWVKILWQAGF